MLEKENGVISEQTYQILVNITSNDQSASASFDEDFSVDSNPSILVMRPEQQMIAFSFRLLEGDLPEVREGFVAASSPTGALQYSPPASLFESTSVVIDDDDGKYAILLKNYFMVNIINGYSKKKILLFDCFCMLFYIFFF